ncbi:uncharacterized protein LOC116383719 [Anarrhichthys ocellatus]|uniref:uncharacterized protein LOC116383719 n=1 Tax=Anarrhichthys ocellatus TaxID=433405 RepID=UPI0012EDA3E2|nr:uncharacterized protein LOC116383719 [Anarrhichthys ocellatus]
MEVVACCFFFAYDFLLLGRAWSISCIASSYSLVPEQTRYNISDDSRITDVNGSDCDYSWARGKHVLANHDNSETEPVVVSYSINHLITSGCFNNTTFRRNCLSEGIGYTVLCEPNCTLNALLRSLKEKEIGATVGATVGPTVGATVGVAVGVIVVLLAVLLSVCLWYKFKDNISSWRRPRCNYTAGTAKEGDPRPAEVEAGNA